MPSSKPPNVNVPRPFMRRIDRWLNDPVMEASQAQRLGGIIAVVLLIGVAIGLITDFIERGAATWHDADSYIMLASVPVLLMFYYLHRTHYHRIVTAGLLVFLAVTIVVAAIPDNQPSDAYLLLYLLLPVVLSSALFSFRLTVVLLLINTAAMAAFPILFDDSVIDFSWSLYMLVISLMVLLVTRYTAQLQHEHQQALSAHEAHTNAMLQAFPDLIFQIDRDCRIVDFRSANTASLYRPPEAFLGRTVDEVLPPDIAQQTHNVIPVALSTGQLQCVEYSLRLPSGELGHFESRLVPLDADHVLSVVRDITEQKQAEAALLTSERIARDTFEAIPDPAVIWERQPDGRMTMALFNRAAAVRSLDRIQQYIGKTVQDFFTETPEVVTYIADALETGEAQRKELRFRVRTSSEDTWQLADYVRIGENRVLNIIHDITSRKQTEETLRRSEARYRTLLTALPDLILRISREGRILDFENAWSGLPAPASDFVGKTLEELIPDQAEQAMAVLNHAFITHTLQKLEIKVPVDDVERAYEARVNPSAGGEAVVIVRDVTAINQARDAEREQRALAEALSSTTAALNETLEPDAVLRRILEGLRGVIPYNGASVLLIEGNEVVVAGSRGYERWTAIDNMRFPLSLFYGQPESLHGGEVRLIPDAQADPRWVQVPETAWIAGHISASIIADGRLLGFLTVDSTIPNIYTAAHGQRLKAFADQMAIALRNAQLFATARRHVEELEALRHVTLNVTAQLDLPTLFDELARSALALINVTEGGVYLYDAERDVLEWKVSVGSNTAPPGTTLRRGEGLSGRVWELGRTIVIDDYSTWADRARVYDSFTWYAAIGVPILWQGELLGVFNAVSSSPDRRFSVHDVQLLELFVNQAAIAMQNARLFAAERAQREYLEALRASVAVVNSSLDPKEVLRRILENTGPVVPHDAAHILLFEGDVALVAGAQGYERYHSDKLLTEKPIRLDERPSLQAMIQTGQGYIVDDTQTNPTWFRVPGFEWIRSHLAAPIRLENQVIGALKLDSVRPGAFKPGDLERIQVFADQAAIAIENARLYAETRLYTDALEQRVAERTTDLSVRNAVAETLSRSLDMTGMLDTVLSTIVQNLGVHGGGIYLLANDDTLELAAHCGISLDTLDSLRSPDTAWTEWPSVRDVERVTFGEGILAGQFCSVLTVPIWQQDRALGVILLMRDSARAWRGEEQRMLDAIGRQIGVAVANVRLYAQAVRDEAQTRTILSNVADGLLVFDQENRLILMNPAAEVLFSFYPATDGGAEQAAALMWDWLSRQPLPQDEEIVEFSLPMGAVTPAMMLTWSSQCDVETCPSFRQEHWPCWLALNSLDETQQRRCLAYQNLKRRSVQAQRADIADPEGDVQGSVIALHDVTYFRELDELKGRFVSNVSHELRTPLSAMLLQVSTLLRYYDHFSDAERRTQLREVQQQSHVLRELIEDILELSRFDAKRSVPQKQWFDLVEYCQQVVTTFELAVHEKHLTLDRVGCAGSHYIFADPHQMVRVLRNLISNAVKFTPEGGTITVEFAQEGSEIRLSVKDTGIGIAPADRDRIFERFFRADDAAMMAAGSGLGLSISREIVQLHGGRIAVESVPNEGSTFTVYLPVSGLDGNNVSRRMAAGELPLPGSKGSP